MTDALHNTITLDDRICGLAQELQDLICGFVFTYDSKEEVIAVDGSYRPPWMLNASRALRERFATQYYDNIFLFIADAGTLLCPWLSSLPDKHLELIKEVRFNWPSDSVWGVDDMHALASSYLRKGRQAVRDVESKLSAPLQSRNRVAWLTVAKLRWLWDDGSDSWELDSDND